MSANPQDRWTAEQYLEFERASDEKHEYIDGEIFLFAGASERHNLISTNVIASLHSQLRQRPCRVYGSDMRVRIPGHDMYTYPDVSVVCGEPRFEDEGQDTLLNPLVVIEVLSPSSEIYDRGRKFQLYRQIDALQEYVLIAQDGPRIERYARHADGWLLTDAARSDAEIMLESVGCVLLLAEVYEKIDFGDG